MQLKLEPLVIGALILIVGYFCFEVYTSYHQENKNVLQRELEANDDALRYKVVTLTGKHLECYMKINGERVDGYNGVFRVPITLHARTGYIVTENDTFNIELPLYDKTFLWDLVKAKKAWKLDTL